jgi:mannose-6-phosphate isomerase
LNIGAENLARLQELREQLLNWLKSHALPLWEIHGVDRTLGGYFESIEFDHDRRTFESRGEIRRGRVVARQMYVFHAGRELGWECHGADPLRHGCDYLFSHLKRDDGHFHTAVEAISRAPIGRFSLYESAFYLFALATVYGSLGHAYPIYESASAFLEHLRAGWGKSNGGFEESSPPSLPLKSNPHLHLLEAALAWVDATAGSPLQTPWVRLAEEIVALSLSRFIDPRIGAVREFFDASWTPMPDASGRIVEPGHQFEWSWLLMKWARSAQCPDSMRDACRLASIRLVELGERFGVDPVRGVAFNELWDDMTPKDASAKLWPQTERVKAWCAVVEDRTGLAGLGLAGLGPAGLGLVEGDSACRSLVQAIQGLQRYLEIEPLGLWQEVLSADGTFSCEPSKASSFYHIVNAIEALDRCTANFATHVSA